MTLLIIAALVFVGCHFLLSHPLRRPLSRALGERAFLGIYSVAALISFAWMVIAFRSAPSTDLLWPTGNLLWAIVSLVMLLASLLLMGSLLGNPALPRVASSRSAPQTARDVYALTRHPMMWAFALWGLCHIAVFPVTKNIVLASAIVILALVGAALQDKKKERLEPDFWTSWEAKTSYWPFAAIISGKSRFKGLRMHTLLGGLVVWLVATWAHIPIAGVAAGIWRWI